MNHPNGYDEPAEFYLFYLLGGHTLKNPRQIAWADWAARKYGVPFPPTPLPKDEHGDIWLTSGCSDCGERVYFLGETRFHVDTGHRECPISG